jgi:hypothetical protein
VETRRTGTHSEGLVVLALRDSSSVVLALRDSFQWTGKMPVLRTILLARNLCMKPGGFSKTHLLNLFCTASGL